MATKSKLILLRHGESEWNKRNLFTGWVDVPLSPKGVEEALEAGRKLEHIPIDVIFVSALMRAQQTAMLAMAEHAETRTPVMIHEGEGRMESWGKIYDDAVKKEAIPVYKAWELNERMYGSLQGLNKQATRERYGEEQVKIWRRSFDVAPPEGESLAMTAARAIPFFKEKIFPYLKKGKNVFISAHGNSLRAIIMFLDNLSKEEVVKLELATGQPIIYEVEGESWKRI